MDPHPQSLTCWTRFGRQNLDLRRFSLTHRDFCMRLGLGVSLPSSPARCKQIQGRKGRFVRRKGGVVQKMSAPDKLGWSFTDVGARSGPSLQLPFHTSVARRRLEQAGEGCTRWGRTGVQMRTGRTRKTKAKRPFKGGEGENHENTGSTAPAPAARLRFCAPSLTKTEPSGCCLLPFAQYGCPIGGKGLPDGHQVYMPNMAKIMAKNCEETHKIDRKSSKRHRIWPMRLPF